MSDWMVKQLEDTIAMKTAYIKDLEKEVEKSRRKDLLNSEEITALKWSLAEYDEYIDKIKKVLEI